MRILWLCNICPPAVAAALGQSYSVREGWLTGALNRFLAEDGDSMQLAVCFPAEGELAGLQKKIPLKEFKTDHTGGPYREKEVSVYGFREDLKRPEVYDCGMEERFQEILEDFRPDLVHIFGTEFPHALAMVKSFGRPERILVGIQGLVGKCAKSYMADLPAQVQGKATFRDILRKDSLRQQQEKLKISGYGKYLRDLIYKNGLEDKVTVLGSLSDVQMKEAYLKSHVFACPSALENSPNSLGEAMLLGLPCVAARTGGIPDMAEDGTSALFFEKGDVHGLAGCIIRIFRNEELARELSEGARDRALRNHDGNENYRRMMEIYHEILETV